MTAGAAARARTLRRVRFREHVRGKVLGGSRRLRASWLPILQCAVAAGLALYVAGDLVGHERPFFAPIAAVISLGVSLNSRLRRSVELVVGVSLGVLVGDLIIARIGSGVWQLILVVALAIALATFFDGGNLLVSQSGASAVLVTTLLPPGETGGLDRCVDALIGGAAGILIAAVIPVNPVRIARRGARRVLDDLAAVLTEVASGLGADDPSGASRALSRARHTQAAVDELRTALASAGEVAAVSPMHRPQRAVLRRYRVLAERVDYAHRNARVLARRALTAMEDGERVPAGLTGAITDLASAVEVLIRQLTRDGDLERARPAVLDAVHGVTVLAEQPVPSPTWEDPVPARSLPVLVAQVRSIAVDLLQATGMSRSEALQALREELSASDTTG